MNLLQTRIISCLHLLTIDDVILFHIILKAMESSRVLIIYISKNMERCKQTILAGLLKQKYSFKTNPRTRKRRREENCPKFDNINTSTLPVSPAHFTFIGGMIKHSSIQGTLCFSYRHTYIAYIPVHSIQHGVKRITGRFCCYKLNCVQPSTHWYPIHYICYTFFL